jgi:predicted nuclease of predicted toxin-antitoxin system
VIDNRDATEIETIVTGHRANFLLIAHDGDTREALAVGLGGGGHCAWITSFGQNNVLRP